MLYYLQDELILSVCVHMTKLHHCRGYLCIL